MNALIHREFLVESDLLAFQRRCVAHARREALLRCLLDDVAAMRIVELCRNLAPPWITLHDASWDAYHVLIRVVRERESEVLTIASDAIYA